MEKEKPLIWYACFERPPGPGAVPREGLVSCEYTVFHDEGRTVWGEAGYDRELTEEELEHYSMKRF